MTRNHVFQVGYFSLYPLSRGELCRLRQRNTVLQLFSIQLENKIMDEQFLKSTLIVRIVFNLIFKKAEVQFRRGPQLSTKTHLICHLINSKCVILI